MLRSNHDCQSSMPYCDLVICGVESSLWGAEQFCTDLQVLFPRLRLLVLSANETIVALAANKLKSIPASRHVPPITYASILLSQAIQEYSK